VTATVEAEQRESAKFAAFRAEAREWLEANATRRTRDVNEFKTRMTATDQTQDGELAHVEQCKAWQRKLFDAGFAGIEVPTEYGGQGRTLAEAQAFRQEMAKYEIDTGVFSVGLAMVVPTVLAHGTEEQKRQHVPALLRGDHVWCQLFSEPGAGSDLAGLTTRAERDGDVWVVNGQKVWNSFAHIADWGILLARTDWDVPKHRGITYFLVDMTTPGVEARPLRQITGVAHFNETFLTDVHIPAANVLGEVNGGWGVTQTTLMAERMLIGGGGMGLGWRD
jgi:alkylation response protein AidB-like acyl-CoA dehydrogenase